MTYRSLENKWKRLQQRPCLFRVSPNRFCYLCSSEYYRERLAQHRCLNQACSEDFWCVPFSRSCRGGSCAAAVPTSGIAKQPLSHPGSYFHSPPPPPKAVLMQSWSSDFGRPYCRLADGGEGSKWLFYVRSSLQGTQNAISRWNKPGSLKWNSHFLCFKCSF